MSSLTRRIIAFAIVTVASAVHGSYVPTGAVWRATGGGYLDAGLHGEYFPNTSFSGAPSFTRRDVRIDFDWGTLLPVGGSVSPAYASFPRDGYSVRWTGRIMARFSETYTFKAVADDTFTLEIKPTNSADWATVISSPAPATNGITGTLALLAGVPCDIRISYTEQAGAACARLFWSSPSTPEEVIDPVTFHGLNAASWAANYCFADLMKRARWSTGTRDAEGWPTSDADLVLADGVDNLHGTYLMEFKGRATVRSTVSGASFLVGTNWITTLTNGLCYDAESNTTRTQMKTGNVNANWIFRFEATQRDNGSPTNTGVTNVRFMRPLVPGTNVPHEAGEVTYRPIREAFGQYSALRWLNVANVDPSFGNWALRTRPGQMQFNTSIGGTNSGECWEYLVMMANECGKDLNVTTPMQADNEYFTKLALLLKYGSDGEEPYQSHQSNPVYPPLNPNLCVYVEVANEIWNWAFGSTQYAQRQGALEVLSNTVDGAVMNYDGKCGTGGIVVTRRYHAVRSVRCSDAFRGVFGDEAMGNRVLMLLEQQYDNAQTETYYSYRFVDNYFNNADGAHVAVPHPLRHYFWGGGGATYYGTGNSYGDQTNIFLADPSFALPVVPDGTAVPGTQGGAWTFTNNAGIYRNASAGVSTQALGTARTVAEPTAVGMRIRTGSATVYVHELGRWYTAGQGGVHTCQLVRASDRQLLAEVRTTGQSGATVKKFSNFRYGRIMAPGTNLPSPVALAPNTEYYIVSFEGPGGDSHRKEGTTVAPGSWFSVEGAVSATLNGAATNPAAWTIAEDAGANLCYGPVNVRCTTNGALAYTRFPWPSFDDQAAFIISNGALSTSVYFDRTGVFAVTFMAAGNGNEYPSYEYFDILADGVCISPRSQTDYRVSPGRAGIGGWSRSTSNFEEYWGSSVFNVTNTGMHTIAFAGCSSKTNNCTVFDEISIASVDEIMNSGFGSGEALGQVAQADYMKQLNAQARYSKAFGLETVAYEAGLSIGGDFTKRPIQMYCYFGDPRGRTMNNAAMDIFTGSGGQMNVWGVYLYWPVYDIVGSKTYPLMRSLADLSGRLRAEGSNGIPVPASLGTNGIIRWIYNNTDSTTTLTNPGAWATWVITCPETRNYSVQVNAASGGVARFEIDGRTIWEAGTHLASGEYARVTLCKGVHGVRIQNRGGAFTLPANGAVVIAPAFPADAPVLAPAPGTYPVTNVTITTATPGATIRYTVDGSVPTEDHGTIYGGPVALSNTAVISAVAFGDNTECSSVVSGNYAILACGISTNAVAVPEGGSATFQVWLTAAPAGTKTVTISRISGDTDISVSAGATRIFTAGNWAAPQTVTLSAAEDLDIHDGSAVILCAAPGVSGAILAAHEDDNDTLGIGVSADAVVVPEGGTNGFSVYLTDAIASPATVTVARAGGDADITVATGTTFVFTPADWGAPRQVILAAAEDSDAADGAATIRCATPGLADTDVTASEGDNDTLEIEVTDTAVTIPEGGVMAFDVRLTAAPVGAGTVVVSRVSGDADITVGAGTTLVFTPATHATWQTVTLAAGEDADASGGSATIRCACDGASGADVAATEDDNDVLAIVAAGAVTVPEGGEAALPVSLSAAPDALTTVTVARTAGDADITIAAGASLVFSAGDWNMPRTVTLAAAGDADMSDGSAVISCTAPGALPWDVTARERDAEAWPACYDGFDATQRVLYGALTGIGWSNNAWQVESPTNISTYRIVNGSLVHEDLATGGNKAEGGYAYQTSGRSFSLSQAFAPWMTNIGGVNYIGRNGTELWVSYVTRLASAAYAGKLSFDDGGAVFHDNSGRVRVRQTAGKWCLSAIADSYASTSSVAVAANTNYLMVLHFTFAPTDTVELFVNPALAGGPPAGPDASVSVATNDASGRDLFRFYDLNWQPGSGTANGWLDELRFGPTFASVTPRIAGVFTNTDDIAVAGMRYCDERSGWTIVFTGTISGTGTVVMASGMTNILVGTVAPGYGPGALAIDCAGGITRLGAPDDFLALEIGNGDMLVLTNFPGAVSLAHTTVAFLDGSTGGMTNWFLYSTSGIADAFAGVTFAPGTAGTVVYDGANNRVGVFIAAVQPVVVVSTNALTVAEGMTGRFGIRLGCAPAGIATVTVSRVSGDTDVFINGGGVLHFTPANWSINQPVTLQTGEDADASDGVAVFRCVSAGSTDVDVTATEGDNDTMAIAVSSTAVSVPEGGAAAFNVWLTAAPETAATVSVSRISGDTDLGVQSGAARVFTAANWATPQPVTLEAAEDADMADGSAVFRCASPGMAGVDVTATEDDNDTTAIIASHESVSVPEGGTAEFQVWLSAAPPADTVVSVARTTGDTDISISAGASLTFTTGNWGEPQTVTLEAAEDADMNNGAATITCSASGIASRDVAASEEDNDAMTLCYDGLDVTQRLLQGTLSGIGWSNNAWQAESPTNISAYRVVNGSLEYGGLVTAGNKIEGGYAYQTVGRSLAVGTTFSPWATNIGGYNYIGKHGTELWMSYVIRLASASYPGKLGFDDAAGVYHDNNGRCRVKQVAGKWCLSAMADSCAATSSVAVAANTNYLMVLHFTFAPTDTVELFVNPVLDGTPPAGPSAVVSVSTNDASGRDLFRFYDINWYPGSGAANGWLDEVRFGPTFASVTPRIAGVFTNTEDVAVDGIRRNDERTGYTVVFTGTISGTGVLAIANGVTNILVGTIAPGFGAGELAIDSAGSVTLLGMPGDLLALEIGNGDLLVLSNFTGAVSLANTTVTFIDSSTGGATNWFLYSTSGIEGAFAGVTFAPGSAGTVIYDAVNKRVGVVISAISLISSRPIVTVPEGGEASFQISLSTEPQGDIVVSVARTEGDADITVSSGASLVFAATNWSVPRTVTLEAANDEDEIDGSATFSCTAPGAMPVDVIARERDAEAWPVCYDGLDVTQRLLQGTLSGIGWSNNAWQAESPTNISAYRVVNGSLEYGGLVTAGNKIEGGYAYQTVGRSLAVGTTFSPWATNIGGVNYIGRHGTELWMSYVTRLASSSNVGKLGFDDAAGVYHDNNGRCRVQQAGGRWCVSAMADSRAATSSVAVAANTDYLMVLHFVFAPTDTVELFVSPALSGSPPAEPDAMLSVCTNDASGRDLFRFYDINWKPASTPASGWLDEVRFGPTFASVTPRIAGVFTNTEDIAVDGMRRNDERTGYTVVFTGTISGTGVFAIANGMTNILVGTIAPGFGAGELAIDSAGNVTLLGMAGDTLALEIGNGDLLVLSNFTGAVSLANTTVTFIDSSTGGATNWFLYSASGIEGAFAGVTFAPGSEGTVIYDEVNKRVGVVISSSKAAPHTPPMAAIVMAPEEVLPGEEAVFDGAAVRGSFELLTCTWDFGDGVTKRGDVSFTHAAHTYTCAGAVCTATFSVIDAGGLSAADSVVVTIMPEPQTAIVLLCVLLPLVRCALRRSRR